MFRIKYLPLTIVLLLVLWGSPVYADEYLGKVVTATEGKLVMKDKSGAQHDFTPDSQTEIQLNGQSAKLDQLMKGFAVTVRTEKKGAQVVIAKIEAESLDE